MTDDSRSLRGWRDRSGVLATGLALSCIVFATACGTNSDGAEGVGSADTANLSADVLALTKPRDAYPVPTEPVGDISSLKGKTIAYIPITKQAPQFTTTEKAFTAAAQAAGLNVQTCDGKGTPTDINACVSQATEAKVAAIVTDAIPYGLAGNALDAAQDADIPVIISNQIANKDHPASKTLGYIPVPGGDQQVARAKWIIDDSGSKARVLVNQSVDGPSPAAYLAAGKAEFDKDCPDCKITVNEVTSANFSLIPSSTSSALLKDPSITYVESQFEQYLQPTLTGAQQTSRTDLKLLSGSVSLGGLKQLKSGDLAAGTAQAAAFQGWVDLDAALRLMLGKSLPEYTIPIRLFTPETMDGVALTEEAELSGEWFGPVTFTDDFKKLWGIG